MTRIDVVAQSLSEIAADVVVLKFADNLHGADLTITRRLPALIRQRVAETLENGDAILVDARSAIHATNILYLPVGPLAEFNYDAIAAFGERSLREVSTRLPEARSVAMTIHGPGYGLDEIRAFDFLLSGFRRALGGAAGLPASIATIAIAENNPRRAQVLETRLRDKWEQVLEPSWSGAAPPSTAMPKETRHAKIDPPAGAKAHIFVAMPFASDFEDIYYYGIQKPVREHGFDCVRVDHEYFVGDIMEHVKSRIGSSALVVADITGASANVYLEVGYAWGRGIPTLFVARDNEKSKFDVQSHHNLLYRNVRDLETKLHTAIGQLVANRVIGKARI